MMLGGKGLGQLIAGAGHLGQPCHNNSVVCLLNAFT